jgi:hypothetical protein
MQVRRVPLEIPEVRSSCAGLCRGMKEGGVGEQITEAGLGRELTQVPQEGAGQPEGRFMGSTVSVPIFDGQQKVHSPRN